MTNVALVTGADRGLGRACVGNLLEQGWTVLAGRHMAWPELDELAAQYGATLHILDLNVSSEASVNEAARVATRLVAHVDLLISNAAINRSAHIDSIREDQNFEDMLSEFSVNAVGSLRLIKAFLPLLDQGNLKRLCFVSSEAGSIVESKRTGWFGYCMSKAALNMAVMNLRNDLGNQGYTFRLYHPGWLRTYMSGTKNNDAHMEPEEGAAHAIRYFLSSLDPEDLVLRDYQGKVYGW